MRRSIVMGAAWLVLVAPAWGQKIEIQKPDRNRIVHVETALNHLTVIEAGEPVMTVAAGSAAFKIEWRENKVFVQPSEPNVATNLFIWTVSGRLNYELEPAGAVEQMDFAIDQPSVQVAAATPRAAKPAEASAPGVVATDDLLGGRPIRLESGKEPRSRVVVLLKDVFQHGNEVFIRYAVRNDSTESYGLGTPRVFTMSVPPQLVSRFANRQLTDTATHFKNNGETPVEVVRGEVRASRIEPGEETVGVVGMKLPVHNDAPTVLRFVFPAAGTEQPTATLVL